MEKKEKSTLRGQAVIFIALFLLCEIALRICGMRAGTLIDDFKAEEESVYRPRFISDEIGINRIIPDTTMLMKGSVINKQGFRGKIEYTANAIDSLRKL